jgi:hypothetical protein
MKYTSSNKEKHSLQSSENYKNESEFDINDAIEKYSVLIIDYFKFIVENIKIKNVKLLKFLIIRGLDTITNVYMNLLYFTKNVDLTYFHSQKAYYFYVEFVGQISDDEKTFLQLTSRDASTYVYKRTIFDMNNELKKTNENVSTEFKQKLDIIKSYINVYQIFFLKIVNQSKIDETQIIHIVKLSEKLNKLNDKSKIIDLESITDDLYSKIENIDNFFIATQLLVNKFIKNKEILKNVNEKIKLEEFDVKLLEPPDKFINWLLQC